MKNIKIKKLEVVFNRKGSILKILDYKKIKNIKEIYCSSLKFNKIKAWKLHKKMTCNLVVLFGKIQLVVYSNNGKFSKFTITGKSNLMISIPPDVWFGMKGLSKIDSVVMNLSSLMHKKNEMINKKKSFLKYKW
ncbi:WxcM-like domain-containing protein [Pelagibacteraceae bacterium]|jgi:dTDP-4-dehydrorhamnose 3,5-epimerase-like enzyme|nr:WxcM-like domain-containing protein [Pelagibacteraceae bacterium]